MEKTKFDEMMSRLPSNIKDTDVLRFQSKKVLAALLELLLHSKAKESGMIFVNNSMLRKLSGVNSNDLLPSIKQLEDYKLIERTVGNVRGKQGEKGLASKYIILFENLIKPLKELSFDDLFSDYLKITKSSEKPNNTTTTTTITTSITNTITNTITNSNTITNTTSNSIANTIENTMANTNELIAVQAIERNTHQRGVPSKEMKVENIQETPTIEKSQHEDKFSISNAQIGTPNHFETLNALESPTTFLKPSNEETPSMAEGLESGNSKNVVGESMNVEERKLQVLENIAVSTDESKAVESPTIVQKSSSGQVPRHDTENVTKGLEMAKFGNVGGDSKNIPIKNMKYSEETLKELEINRILDKLREEAFKLLEESASNCKDLYQLNELQMKVVSFMGQKCPTSEIQRRLNGVIFNKVSRLKKDYINSLLESPTIVQNSSCGQVPRHDTENVTKGLESGNFPNCSMYVESADEDFLNEALKMSPIHEKSYRY